MHFEKILPSHYLALYLPYLGTSFIPLQLLHLHLLLTVNAHRTSFTSGSTTDF
jgi:hypothetical protein